MKLSINPKPEAEIKLDAKTFKTRLKETLDIFYAIEKSIIELKCPEGYEDWFILNLKLMTNWEVIIHSLESNKNKTWEFRVHSVSIKDMPRLTPGFTNGKEFEFEEKKISADNLWIVITPMLDPDFCIQTFMNKLQYEWIDLEKRMKWKPKIDMK